MLKILKRTLAPFFRLFGKDLVVFLETHRGSGSNVFALYTALKDDSLMRYQCRLVRRSDRGFRPSLRREILLAQAKWIVQDHGGQRRYPGQKVIELWHGIPLKTMNLMDANDKSSWAPVGLARSVPDVVLSSSRLYETLLSACRCVPAQRYRRFGFPRLRWLGTDRVQSRRLLGNALGQTLSGEKKLILWVPTHRRIKSKRNGHDQSVIPSLLKKYLNEDLAQALQANHARLILKPHPNDEPAARALIENLGDRVSLLTGDSIAAGTEDLYRLLPGTDALITDYSSVYFDYLLLDKPIGFMLDDLEQYRRERGFLLEPVTDWMPGPTIVEPGHLRQFIEEIGAGEDPGHSARESLRQTFFPDGIVDTAALVREHIFK